MQDFRRLQSDPVEGITACPHADNILLWDAVIFGPVDTPFEDGTFKLSLTFDESYPTKAPNWLPSSVVQSFHTPFDCPYTWQQPVH